MLYGNRNKNELKKLKPQENNIGSFTPKEDQ